MEPAMRQRARLLRAYLDQLVGAQAIPYLLVDATYSGVIVPDEYVKQGRIVLNIAPKALAYFKMSDSAVQFQATFIGVPWDIYVPLNAVLAIYARDSQEGLLFEGAHAYEMTTGAEWLPRPNQAALGLNIFSQPIINTDGEDKDAFAANRSYQSMSRSAHPIMR